MTLKKNIPALILASSLCLTFCQSLQAKGSSSSGGTKISSSKTAIDKLFSDISQLSPGATTHRTVVISDLMGTSATAVFSGGSISGKAGSETLHLSSVPVTLTSGTETLSGSLKESGSNLSGQFTGTETISGKTNPVTVSFATSPTSVTGSRTVKGKKPQKFKNTVDRTALIAELDSESM